MGVNGSVAYSINGGRTEYNNWEIDGGDNMDNGSNSTLNVYPSVDAIAEFKVLTSNYGAQYGRNASGTIEVETKSGTNRFHGTASYFGRNEIFNAYNYFDDPTLHKPAYKKHDFGYTVGGPVFRDKTFFFWSQEWRRERNPKTFTRNVPSDAERAGDFSDVLPDVSEGVRRKRYYFHPPSTPCAKGRLDVFEALNRRLTTGERVGEALVGLGYISDLVAGIYWAVDGPDGYFGTADDFQADAINISIGTRGTDTYPSVFCDAAVPAMTDATCLR